MVGSANRKASESGLVGFWDNGALVPIGENNNKNKNIAVVIAIILKYHNNDIV